MQVCWLSFSASGCSGVNASLSLYLLLALPALYTVVLNSVLLWYTNFTVSVLRDIVARVPVAVPTAVPGDALFTVTHHGHSFDLQVVTACSGVDGLVGFLLIGLLFAAMVSGPLLRKSIWLFAGLPLLWAINLGRMMFIFWVGKEWGETIALDVFHPFIGLVTFSAGVTIWALAHRWLGLRIRGSSIGSRPAGGGVAQPAKPPRAAAIPAIAAATIVVVIASVVVGIGDNNLKSYNLIENAVGQPRLASFLVSPAHVPGWTSAYDQQFFNGEPEFGPSSLWYRYLYRQTSNTARVAVLRPDFCRRDKRARDIGVQRVHGPRLLHLSRLVERGTVDENLGGGIVGQALSYDSSQYGDWSLVYWIWPVNGTAGEPSASRYERVVLYLQDGGEASVRDPLTGVTTSATMSLDERLTCQPRFPHGVCPRDNQGTEGGDKCEYLTEGAG